MASRTICSKKKGNVKKGNAVPSKGLTSVGRMIFCIWPMELNSGLNPPYMAKFYWQ